MKKCSIVYTLKKCLNIQTLLYKSINTQQRYLNCFRNTLQRVKLILVKTISLRTDFYVEYSLSYFQFP